MGKKKKRSLPARLARWGCLACLGVLVLLFVIQLPLAGHRIRLSRLHGEIQRLQRSRTVRHNASGFEDYRGAIHVHSQISHDSLGTLEQIVEGAQDAIVFADPDGIIHLWNQAAERIFGYSVEEALGQTLDLIVPENMRERHWEGYRKVMATGVTKYGSELLAVPAINSDGRRMSVEFTIILLKDATGEPLGTAAIMRDVTERWLKEKELKKRLSELEKR